MRQKDTTSSRAGADGSAAPLDLAHLSRQAMGDPALAREVLAMFLRQAEAAREEIGRAKGAERARLAHTLKGAARAVGAFGVADCAEAIEQTPDDEEVWRGVLSARIDEVRAFVAGTAAAP